jgi:nicotinamide riboside kinase
MNKKSNHEPKQITVLGGAFSVGKSTLQGLIEAQHGDKIHYIPDYARTLLEQRGGIEVVQGEGPKALQDFQMDVLEAYIRGEAEALKQNKPVLADGSLIEVLAYSQGILGQTELNLLHNLIRQRNKIYQVVHLRPTTECVEDDGLRHTDLVFQKIIDKRVQDIATVHHVPRFSIVSADLQKRYAVAMFTLLHGDNI